jgi:hypothetical protein
VGPRVTIAIVAATAAGGFAIAAWSAPTRPATTRGQVLHSSTAAAGLSWQPPPGWRPVERRLTELTDPRESLAAATFAVPAGRRAPACDPRALHRLLPARGAIVLLLESRWAAGVPSRLRAFPPRPRRFRLPRRAVPLECSGLARAVAFRERGRGFNATVLLGRRAPRSRLREAEQLLDSLRVEAVPPPRRDPWELWPLRTTEAGDSMHVPPGWTSGVLDVPRRIHRPRLLFYAATEPVASWTRGRRERLGHPREPATRGVAVWVTEHLPGRVSKRYPSLREAPFKHRTAFQPWGVSSRRAGGAWRGYRFSVTITAGEDAAPEDVERAYQSAASVALSGGLRDCSRAAQQRRPDLCAGAR